MIFGVWCDLVRHSNSCIGFGALASPLGTRTLLGAPGITSRSKDILKSSKKSAGPGARRVLGSCFFVSSLLSYVLSVLVPPPPPLPPTPPSPRVSIGVCAVSFLYFLVSMSYVALSFFCEDMPF